MLKIQAKKPSLQLAESSRPIGTKSHNIICLNKKCDNIEAPEQLLKKNATIFFYYEQTDRQTDTQG